MSKEYIPDMSDFQCIGYMIADAATKTASEKRVALCISMHIWLLSRIIWVLLNLNTRKLPVTWRAVK